MDPISAHSRAIIRVHRNFWMLVAATVVAIGVLSEALTRPAGAGTAAVVAASGLAAMISLALAARILTVTTSRRGSRRQRPRPRGR